MTRYAKGANVERKVAEHLRRAGWTVVRAAGSKGPGDLVAGRAGLPTRLIEVKSTKASPWSHFGPADRTLIAAEAERAGWVPQLAWWPAGKSDPAFIEKDGWPGGR